jgi:hypothetical protein
VLPLRTTTLLGFLLRFFLRTEDAGAFFAVDVGDGCWDADPAGAKGGAGFFEAPVLSPAVGAAFCNSEIKTAFARGSGFGEAPSPRQIMSIVAKYIVFRTSAVSG